MAGQAVGRLGISVEAFYGMSPREFYFALKTHSDAEADKMISASRRQYEVARFQAVILLGPHLPKGHSIKDPRKLCHFDWEKGMTTELDQMKMDQMKSILRGIASSQNAKVKREEKLKKRKQKNGRHRKSS